MKILSTNEKLTDSLMNLFDLIGLENYDEVPEQLVTIHENYIEYIESEDHSILAVPNIKFDADYKYYQKLSDMGLPYEDENITLTGTNLAASLVNNFWGLPLIILLILLCVSIFTSENEDGTYKLRRIQPIKRVNIFLSKFFASLSLALVFLISMLMFAYLIGGIFGNGFGSFKYPVALGPQMLLPSLDSPVLFEISSLWKTVGYSFLSYFSFLSMIMGIVAFLSVIFKDTLKTSVFSILIYGVGHYLTSYYIVNRQWINSIEPEFPIFNPFGVENFKMILADLRINNFYFLLIPVVLGFILTIFSYLLELNPFIQSFMRGGKIKDIEKSLTKWKSQKKTKVLPLLRFEIKKLIKRQELKIVFLTILVGVLFYGSYIQNNYTEAYSNSLETQKWNVDRMMYLEDYKGVEDHTKFIEGFEKNDNEIIGRALIKDIYDFSDFSTGFHGYVGIPIPGESAKINVEEVKEVIERENKVALPKAYPLTITPFDKFKDFQSYQRYNTYAKRYHPSTHFSLNSFFKDNLFLILFGIVIFSIATGFTLEKQDKDTLRLLKIQPKNRKNIYIGKQSSQILMWTSIMGVVLISVLVIGALTGTNKDANYPVPYYDTSDIAMKDGYQGINLLKRNLNVEYEEKSDGFYESTYSDRSLDTIGLHFRNITRENIDLIGLLLLTTIFIITLGMFLSLWVSNRWVNGALIFIIISIGYIASEIFPAFISLLLPFSRFNIPETAAGILAINRDLNLLNPNVSYMVMLFWILAITTIGAYIFNGKKDNVIGGEKR